MILEKMMEVYERYSEHREKKDKARSQNRKRHEPIRIKN